jgi:microcystin-dependent protein
MTRANWLCAAWIAAGATCASPAFAEAIYVGQVQATAATYCPKGTLEANGQVLQISSYQVLFSLLGVTYGGDGSKTFALPDLRGRVTAGQGSGPGLPPLKQGQQFGAPSTTLTVANIAHSHDLNGTSTAADSGAAAGGLLATRALHHPGFTAMGAMDTTMDAGSIAPAGSASPAPVSLYQPSLVIRYCIALDGLYPSP